MVNSFTFLCFYGLEYGLSTLDTSKESVFCCLRAMCPVIVNQVNWIDRVILVFHVFTEFLSI